MRLLLAVSVAAVLLTGWPSHGKKPSSKKKAPEELGELFAKRIQRATGVRIHIKRLVYEVLTSTFIGRGIEAGPAGRAHVAIPHLRLELKLFAKGPGATVSLLQVDRPRVKAQARWIDQIYGYAVHRAATVKRGRVKNGTVVIHHKGGVVELRGVQIAVQHLRIPRSKAGRVPALQGKLTLAAKEVRLGKLRLGGLRLKAKLAKTELQIAELKLGLPGGGVTLSGTVGFGNSKRGPGPVALTGPFKVMLRDGKGPELSGTMRLKGSSLGKLTLDGKVPSAKGLPRAGGVKGAPRLDLRMRAGGRRLQGGLHRWRLR